jgi:hypothetical protein
MNQPMPEWRDSVAELVETLSVAKAHLAERSESTQCLRVALELLYVRLMRRDLAWKPGESWVDSLIKDLDGEDMHEMPMEVGLFSDQFLLVDYVAFHIEEAKIDAAQILIDSSYDLGVNSSVASVALHHIASHTLAAFCASVLWAPSLLGHSLNGLLRDMSPQPRNGFDVPDLAEKLHRV